MDKSIQQTLGKTVEQSLQQTVKQSWANSITYLSVYPGVKHTKGNTTLLRFYPAGKSSVNNRLAVAGAVIFTLS